MKHVTIITLLIAFCFLAVSLNAQSKSKQDVCTDMEECCKKASNKKSTTANTPKMMISTAKKDKVIACKLTSPELQKRKNEVIALLKQHILEHKEITNGYQYTFKGSDNMIDDLVSFIKTERACCSFFSFNLQIEDSESHIQLTITGPEGAREFISSEMGL